MAKQTVSDNRKSKDKKLHILFRMVISFYLHYINTFVLSRLFYYSERFLHYLVWKNKGQVYTIINKLKLKKLHGTGMGNTKI